MANIKIELGHPIIDGMPLSFRAPCNCNEVTGIKVKWHDGDEAYFIVFSFADSHGNDLTGLGNLFATGVMVRVVLDVPNAKAFIQNADTNAYLEAQLASKAPAGFGLGESQGGFKLADLDSITAPGWYSIADSGTIVNTTANYWYLHVVSYGRGTSHCTQELTVPGARPITLKRNRYSGNWRGWGYDNPMMDLDVSYPTNEFLGGERLHCKYVKVTDIDGVGLRSGRIVDYEVNKLVRYHATVENATKSAPLPTSGLVFEVESIKGNRFEFYIEVTQETHVGKAVYCQLWYTKL